ncbi:MAG: HlyU family transcriptional regulator [Pseudomonadota bacterium]
MSFLKKLFGGGGSGEAKPAAEADYEGFHIAATPMPEGGQYRLAASVTKEIDGETKTHKLIRADVFMSADEAADAAIRKGKQMIDEQGERIFS